VFVTDPEGNRARSAERPPARRAAPLDFTILDHAEGNDA
jgi:hypothetical protein